MLLKLNRKMDLFCNYYKSTMLIIVCLFWSAMLDMCSAEDEAQSRALEMAAPWRPLPHHLISLASLESPNKAHLIQIAQHNAQLLRQIKGFNQQPITQYQNPFPLHQQQQQQQLQQQQQQHQANTTPKQQQQGAIFNTNNGHHHHHHHHSHTATNLLSSGSNVAHTILPPNHLLQNAFMTGKPTFLATKPELNPFKYLSSMHSVPSQTSKIQHHHYKQQQSSQIQSQQQQQSQSLQHHQHQFLAQQAFNNLISLPANTNHRYNGDITLTPPPVPPLRSTQKPHPAMTKLQTQQFVHAQQQAKDNANANAYTNDGPADSLTMPSQHVLSSFTHYGPASHLIRESKPNKITGFPGFKLDQSDATYPGDYSGHFIPNIFPKSVHPLGQNFQNIFPQHKIYNNHYHNHNPFNGIADYSPPKQKHLFEPAIVKPSLSVSGPSFNAYAAVSPQPPSLSHPSQPLQPQQSQQPALPSLPPSVLTPFFQQVQNQQAQSSPPSYLQNSQSFNRFNQGQPSSHEPELFKVIDDQFTKQLVPPPPLFKPQTVDNSSPPYRPLPQIINPTSGGPNESVASEESHENDQQPFDLFAKYAPVSPLQDANRFIYNTGPLFIPTSTIATTLPAPTTPLPTTSPSAFPTSVTTPQFIFTHLNRPSSSSPSVLDNNQKAVPQPTITANGNFEYKSVERPTSQKPDIAVTHSFFTIEDAVTIDPIQHFQIQKQKIAEQFRNNHTRDEQQSSNYGVRIPTEQHEYERDDEHDEESVEVTTATTTTTVRPRILAATSTEINSSEEIENPNLLRIRGRPKMRRRRPKPQTVVATSEEDNREVEERPVVNFNRHRVRPNAPHEERVVAIGNGERPMRGRRPESSTPRGSNRYEELPSRGHRQRFSTTTTTTTTTTEQPASSPSLARPSSEEVVEIGGGNPFLPGGAFKNYRRPEIKHFLPTIQTDEDQGYRSPFQSGAPSTTGFERPDTTTTILSRPLNRNRVGYTTTTSTPPPPDTLSIFEVSTAEPITTQGLSLATSVVAGDVSNEVSTPTRDDTFKVQTIPVDLGYEHIRHRTRFRYKERFASSPAPVTEDISHEEQDEPTGLDAPDTEHEMTTSENEEIEKTATIPETSSTTQPTVPTKSNQLKPITKYNANSRPRFSIKEFRQRQNSASAEVAASSTVASPSSTTATKLRFPTRTRIPIDRTRSKTESNLEEAANVAVSSTESVEPVRKRYQPKDGRLINRTSLVRPSAVEVTPSSTATPPVRRASTRRDFANNRNRASSTVSPVTEARVPIIRNATQIRRPQTTSLRKRIEDYYRRKTPEETSAEAKPKDTKYPKEQSEHSEPIEPEETSSGVSLNAIDLSSSATEYVAQPATVTEEGDQKETAIMKIAKDDHSYRPYAHKTSSTQSTFFNDEHDNADTTGGEQLERTDDNVELPTTIINNATESNDDLKGAPSDHSQRVAELTISGNTGATFKSVNVAHGTLSRKVPGYFTLVTDDPILPIEAFFPEVKKD